jgi:hypothetical protein
MAYTTIDDPSAHFQVATWSGNNSNQAITNDGNSDLQPDLVWIKARNESSDHALLDSTRGLTKRLHSNTNDQETNDSSATMSSFDSDGFTMTQYNVANDSDDTGVAWQWKANGGTTSSNSTGDITTTVQANTTAGFSIVTWTSAGSTNVGHGLGVAPNFIIMKALNASSENWLVGSDEIVWTKRIRLNLDSASATSSAFGQAPTSSIFYCSPASSSYNYVAYCFAEKQGYSKFGEYTGNGNADGPFVYTGFKPAWTMIKEIPNAGSWYINDNKRDTFNLVDQTVYADLSNAEATESNNSMDYLSNGFKLRGTGNDTNLDDSTYIYMAFAEHPFVSSEGVPTTAR